MNIDQLQLDLIQKSKKYIAKKNENGLDTASLAEAFFVVGDAPGYYILKNFIDGKRSLLNKIYIYFKFLYSICKLSGYKIYNNNNKIFTKIVVSWSKKDDFLNDGSYNDRYFKTNSKENNEILWFLVSVDCEFPEKLDDNIIIFSKKNNHEQSLFYLVKVLFINLFVNKFSAKNFFYSLSYYPHISEIIFKRLKPLIMKNNFKKIFTPYETQPFQNYLFKNIKKLKKNIETVGYIHSSQPFPIHNLYRDGAPDKLFVHGSDQKFHLTNYLGWPNDVVNSIPSLRFRKEDKLEIEQKVLLPYFISNSEIYLREFKNLLSQFTKNKIKPLKIVNHPQMINSRVHLNLIKKLEKLLESYQNIFSKEGDQSKTFILGGSSVVIEALERGYKLIHICAEPILESYCNTLWPNISVTKINDYVFKYKLKNFGACINLGVEDNMFQKYCVDQ